MVNNSLNKPISKSLPFLFWIVLVCTLLAVSVKGRVLGFNISGLGWFIPFLGAVFIFLRQMRFVSFPIWIWTPWLVVLLLYLVISEPSMLDPRVSPLQRSIQLLCPLMVGLAASSYRITPAALGRITAILEKFTYLLFIVSVLGALSSIVSLQASGLAAEVMTGMFLGIFFINRYLMFGRISDLRFYALMTMLPVLAITRTVIAVMLLAIPISFGSMSKRRRLAFIGLGLAVGLWIFSLPQVQDKMFFSGHGEITDINMNNPDFATSGRSLLWKFLYAEAQYNHWFGHGTGRAETATYLLSPVGYPHNDWLLTYFDYGVIGVVIFLLCNIAMLWHCLLSAKKAKNQNIKLFFIAGASSIVPFVLVMFTDNIMVYASFFGNLQYLIIGLAYGALQSEKNKNIRPSAL